MLDSLHYTCHVCGLLCAVWQLLTVASRRRPIQAIPAKSYCRLHCCSVPAATPLHETDDQQWRFQAIAAHYKVSLFTDH